MVSADRTRRTADKIAALFISLILHALILFCLAGSRRDNNSPTPALQIGESALAITLVSADNISFREKKPEPIEEITSDFATPDSEAIVVSEKTEEEPESKEEESEETNEEEEQQQHIDILTKGVEGAAYPASEIKPHYPLGSRMRGEEGIVTLEIKIATDGKASEVEIIESSGYPALDRSAIKATEEAVFVGADGKKISSESQTTISFRFRLTD